MGILYIDESGDPGFALKPGRDASASELLTVAGVYFPSARDLHRFRLAYAAWREGTQRPKGREFKFANEKAYHRRGFLRAATTVDWRWDAFVLVKERVVATWLPPEVWYRRSFNYLLTNVSQHAEPGTLVFADRRDMSHEIRHLLRQEVAKPKNRALPGRPKCWHPGFYGQVRFLDSANSEGVQLADAIAGAVSFACRTWYPTQREYRDLVASRRHCLQKWP